MAWQDYIAILGYPGDVPSGEIFSGIGAEWKGSDGTALRNTIYTNWTNIAAWCLSVCGQIATARAQKRAGQSVTPISVPAKPTISMPSGLDWKHPGWPAYWLEFQAGLVQTLYDYLSLCATEYGKDLSDGGIADPLLSLFKKFGFIDQNSKDQGFPSLTSLLLLIGERAVEIYDAGGYRDVFLDTRVHDEEG